MTDDRGSTSDIAIERGEIYEHETHGRVTVLGIWRGVRSIDETGKIEDADGLIVVCYTIGEDDHPVGELSDTLESFLSSVQPAD